MSATMTAMLSIWTRSRNATDQGFSAMTLKVAAALTLTGLLAGCGKAADVPPSSGQAEPVFVGAQACASCHAEANTQWAISDHHESMQVVNSSTVKGDFSGTRFTYHGVESSFTSEGGRSRVRTDGPDGRLADFEVKYVFGFRPLQQYLLELPGGRYQALGVSWDSRSKAEGGQRWFHQYQDEQVDHRDVLHWTAPSQNWNYTCAECHSTNLQKNYHADTKTYATTYSEINVSCEACHGPGSAHVAWAARDSSARAAEPSKGLVFSMRDTSGGTWTVPAGQTIARRIPPLASRAEVETCARCHARRGQSWLDYQYGQPLASTHRVALLDEGLYEADGQQRDEVFEYGSFLQSRMYAAGVTCTDCHDPHTGKRKAQGNALCTQCHVPTVYDVPSHTHHRAGTPAADCRACHMPARNYMVVDARRDHGFKVPRPDESVAFGTPNACTSCHADKPASWAAAAVTRWYGSEAAKRPSFTAAFVAGRTGAPGANARLIAIIADVTQPAIVRATALSLLSPSADPAQAEHVRRAARDPDPLVRRAAANASLVIPPPAGAPVLISLLADPVRTVRLEAVGELVTIAGPPSDPQTRSVFDRVADEFRQSQAANAERPEAQVTLGAFEARLGRVDVAEAAYRTAIALQPQFSPAYVNLADLFRALGRDAEGEQILRDGLGVVPAIGQPALQHALGLQLVRGKRYDEAMKWLRLAAEGDAGNARYAFVYGVALHDTGQATEGRRVLERAAGRHPGNIDILSALVAFSQEAGDAAAGRRWAAALDAARR
jgi:predicted CXXCH cytochrome family protein